MSLRKFRHLSVQRSALNVERCLVGALAAVLAFGPIAAQAQVGRVTADQSASVLKLTGAISPAQLVANTNDWAPTGFAAATVVRLSTDASRNLTGLAGGTTGRYVLLSNIGSFPLVLVAESVSSTAANRFALPANFTLSAGQTANLVYDGTSARWRVVGSSGGTVSSVALTAPAFLTVGGSPVTGSGTLALTLSGTALPETSGGTGIISYTVGDLIQATGSNALGTLAAVATGNVLLSGGVGTVSSWGKVGLATHVSGTLGVANGGTGATTGTVAFLANTQTFTGINTFTPTARSSGTAPYLTVNIPADTGITAATESIGYQHATATRTWAGTGTVALQRERFFAGPTYASASASQTFTDAFNLYLTPPVAGINANITRNHTLGIVDATSASSPITGGLIVATTLGTAATSVGIGGGNVFAGGTITGNQLTSTVATGTAPLVVTSTTNVANLNASSLNGATFAAPGAIGSTTPSTGAFTTLSASGLITSTVGAGAAFSASSATTGQVFLQLANTGGTHYIGLENSTGSAFGATAYALVRLAPFGRVIQDLVNGAVITTTSSTGLAVTGILGGSGTTYISAGTSATAPGSGNTTTGATLDGGLGIVYGSRSSDASGVFNTNADGTLIGWNRSGSRVGSISVTTTATAYNTSSDERLKLNFRPIQNSGQILDALEPSLFDWKSGEKDTYGFGAQRTYRVFPQMVSKGDDDPNTITRQWSIDPSKLVPVLTAELQSLRARVAHLENR